MVAQQCPNPTFWGIVQNGSFEPTFWVITLAALADSLNPCAITVLLILMASLIGRADSDKKILLRNSLIFIITIYLTYLVIGLGLCGVVTQFAQWSGWIDKIVGSVAVIIGLANIKDYFWYGGGGFVAEIPRAWRPLMKNALEKASSPIAVALAGVLVTLFELPCTGGPYLFTVSLLSKYDNWLLSLLTLLYYNIIFVAPLLLIVGLVYWGTTSIEKATAWKNRNFKLLHLLVGLLMTGLGVWLFFK